MLIIALALIALIAASLLLLPRRWGIRVAIAVFLLPLVAWSVLFLTKPPTQEFFFGDRSFDVPEVYAPVSFAENTLSISVTPLDMTPFPEADVPNVWLRLDRGDTVDRPMPDDVSFAESASGLERATSARDPVREMFVRREGETLLTFVECFDSFCLHRFTPTGRDLITFEHERTDLADWEVMQANLTTLFESFAR